MKMTKLFAFLLVFLVAISCNKKEVEENTGNNSSTGTLGEVGNTWNVKVDGSHNISTTITEKEGDVYTLEVSYAKLVTKTLKFGFTDNEVVDYVYSKSDMEKPFTMVKFDAEVGDVYTAEIDGIYHERNVVERTVYNIPALGKNLETIGVYEWIPYEVPSGFFGFTIREIIWYWHPVYGLVCVDVYTEEGDFIQVEFIQIDL